ncbi:hypothetical protein TCAL_05894, partial [Tigriopus californicus]
QLSKVRACRHEGVLFWAEDTNKDQDACQNGREKNGTIINDGKARIQGIYSCVGSSLHPPFKKTLRDSLIRDMYQEDQESLMNHLYKASCVAITTDGWSSRNMTAFLAITCHFFDEETSTLECKIMDCSRIKGSHTAENLRSRILTSLVQYKVEKKIVCAISDNAANIQKALGTLSFPHQPCYSHLLNLVVKKSLYAVIVLLLLISLRICTSSLVPTPKKLMAKVETRWNSTFMMLERFLECKNVLTLLFAGSFFEGKSDGFKFFHSEWDSIQDMVHCLSHIYEATQEMGGEKHTTIGKTIPMTTVLMKAYQEEVEESKTSLTKELAQEILKNLHLRFGRVEFDSMYTFSTLLDPRYKNCMLRNTGGLDQALTELKEELKKGSIVSVSGSDIPSASYEGVLSSQASLWTKMDR